MSGPVLETGFAAEFRIASAGNVGILRCQRTVGPVAYTQVSESRPRDQQGHTKQGLLPIVEFVKSPSGRMTSRVVGGLDVWEYIFTARVYDGSVAATAEHLHEPYVRVEVALGHYAQHPEDVDERLEFMDRVADDPERYLPGVEVVRIS